VGILPSVSCSMVLASSYTVTLTDSPDPPTEQSFSGTYELGPPILLNPEPDAFLIRSEPAEYADDMIVIPFDVVAGQKVKVWMYVQCWYGSERRSIHAWVESPTSVIKPSSRTLEIKRLDMNFIAKQTGTYELILEGSNETVDVRVQVTTPYPLGSENSNVAGISQAPGIITV